MARNNQLTKLIGLSQARIDDHHKPHCGNCLELTQLLLELNNDVGYCLFLNDTKCHDDSVFLSLVSYMPSVISREILRKLKSLKIENNVSILGVRR
jgi:hypothetical protein